MAARSFPPRHCGKFPNLIVFPWNWFEESWPRSAISLRLGSRSAWEFPTGFRRDFPKGTRLFIEAAVGDQGSPRSVELAARALELALDASGILVTAYSDRSLSLRRMATWKLTSFLGADLGASPLDDSTAGQFIATFNAANVPLAWNAAEIAEEQFSWEIADQQIQWCRRNGLTVCAGPLLQLDRHSVPHWLHPWEGDFNEILGFAAQYIEAAVRRYQGKVDLWQCAGRINTADFLSLSEEENVRLAARAIEITQSLDPKGRIFVSFDQPWAEYMAHRQKNFSPIHFADALLRAGIGLTGIVLEINIACARAARCLASRSISVSALTTGACWAFRSSLL